MSRKIKRAKINKYIWQVFAVAVMVFFMSRVTVYADEVSDASSAVVQVVIGCVDKQNNTYYIHKGTGTVIGLNSDSQYVLADKSVLTASAEEIAQIRKWNAIDATEELNIQYFILVEPDIVVPATEVTRGSDYPYMILKLESSIKTSDYPKISKSSSAKRGSAAYMLAYNSDSDILGDKSISPESLSSIKGMFTEVSAEKNLISCDIVAKSGAAGAPLFTENGNFVGMIYADADDNLSVMTSDTIMTVLKQFDIQYATDEEAGQLNVASPQLIQSLNELLEECEKDIVENADKYSSSSFETYQSAVTSGIDVAQSGQYRRDSYTNAINNIKKAQKKLKPKYFVYYVVEAVLGALILIISIMNILQYKKTRRLNDVLHENNPCIIRSDNGQSIKIGEKLVIGKDNRQADYVIDNSTISRQHATIIKKKKHYYIIDNNSTNHTRINGDIIIPGKAYRIKDSDILQLSDVSFMVKM